MDRLQNIETFVRVAQTQNFTEAARQLRIARSVVTNRIQQLEEYVGAPLFHRSTRVVRLTEVGQAFQRDCTELVSKASDIVDQMRDVRGSPAGTLSVHALTGFVAFFKNLNFINTQQLRKFLACYKIKLHL